MSGLIKMKIKKDIIRYSLLTGVVFVAHALSGFLEEMVVAGNESAWVLLFIWYTAFLWVGDKVITKYA